MTVILEGSRMIDRVAVHNHLVERLQLPAIMAGIWMPCMMC